MKVYAQGGAMGIQRQVKTDRHSDKQMDRSNKCLVKFHTPGAILRSKIKRYIKGEKNNEVYFRSKKVTLHKRNYMRPCRFIVGVHIRVCCLQKKVTNRLFTMVFG